MECASVLGLWATSRFRKTVVKEAAFGERGIGIEDPYGAAPDGPVFVELISIE